jgi:hypothetical protein
MIIKKIKKKEVKTVHIDFTMDTHSPHSYTRTHSHISTTILTIAVFGVDVRTQAAVKNLPNDVHVRCKPSTFSVILFEMCY